MRNWKFWRFKVENIYFETFSLEEHVVICQAKLALRN